MYINFVVCVYWYRTWSLYSQGDRGRCIRLARSHTSHARRARGHSYRRVGHTTSLHGLRNKRSGFNVLTSLPNRKKDQNCKLCCQSIVTLCNFPFAASVGQCRADQLISLKKNQWHILRAVKLFSIVSDRLADII